MEILTVPFEEPIIINVKGTIIRLIMFKTLEHGNVKFGIDAPRTINIHREEIFHAINQKALEAALASSV